MESKEKAYDLMNKMCDYAAYTDEDDCFTERETMYKNGKALALINVNEILHQLIVIKSSTNDTQSINERIDFFNKVKQEIEDFEIIENHSRNDDKVLKFTENTPEIRLWLESKGFKGLSFFQGGEFIYVIISIRANKNGEWKEKDYSTFNEKDKERMDFLNKEISTPERFKNYVVNLS